MPSVPVATRKSDELQRLVEMSLQFEVVERR
jgi:hypothetical protein